MPTNQDFWEEYLNKVTDEDIRLITRWEKILHTLLVYVGFHLRSTTPLSLIFEIDWTLHRRLDGIHDSGVEYVSTKSGGCNEKDSH
jgi:hypothetical protein